MKYIYTLLFSFLFTIVYGQNETFLLQCKTGDSIINIKTAVIDSITFQIEGPDVFQNIWCGSQLYRTEVKDNDIVGVSPSLNEYNFISDKKKGCSTILTNNGDYCSLLNDSTYANMTLAVMGNLRSSQKDYAIVDSVGLIHSISLDDSIYSFIYGKDSLIVYLNNDWKCNIPYDVFSHRDNMTRASWLTRNPIFNLLNRISQISNYIKEPVKSAISDMLKAQIGNNNDWLNLLIETLDGIDLLDLLRFLDKALDSNYFGDAFISTLDPKQNSMCNYDLGCYTTIPSMDTPFYKENKHRGVSYTFRVGMNLHEDIIGGKNMYQETEALDFNTWFNFSDLNVGTSYTFEPRLDVEYSISDEAYWLSIGENPKKIGPQKVRKSIYGEEKKFTIGLIECGVGEPQNVTDKSADLECTYSNIPEGAICGVKVVNTTTKEEMKISNGTTEGTRITKVAGLKPNTDYAYTGYVTYKGVDYPSWNGGGFTTLPPDISGTWTCKETHYKFSNINFPYYTTYTVTLNEDGSVSCSDTSGIISSSWTFKSNGEVEFEIMDLATQTANSGKKWKGNIDDMDNPQKITGYTNRWNYNQNGFFNGDAVEFEMTR